MRSITIAITLCGLLLLTATAAFAKEALKDVKPGEVPSYCGIAVGEEEQKYDASGPMPWTLKLIFADKETRAYLSDVEVTVTDKDGTQWLQTLCEGAWIVMSLPEGTYKLDLIYGNSPQEHTVSVTPDKTTTKYYFW